MSRRPIRRGCTAAVASVLALVAAACGDDDGGSASSTTTTAAPTTQGRSTGDPGSTAPGDPLADADTCESGGEVTISHPSGWESVAGCTQFGPAPVAGPEPGTDERTGVVAAHVEDVGFSTASDPAAGEEARAATTVDGLQAVRLDQVSSGDGLHPEGTRSVRWLVDLAIGTDDGAGTLVVDAVDVHEDVDFDAAVRVLDRMARSLEVEAGDAAQHDDVVARYEGGGAPFVAAAAPAASSPETCVRVVEPDGGITCVDAAGDTSTSLSPLDGPEGPLTAGITGPEVWSIELATASSSLTYLPVPYPGRDSRALAVPIDPADIASVTLRAHDGTVVAEPAPDDVVEPGQGGAGGDGGSDEDAGGGDQGTPSVQWGDTGQRVAFWQDRYNDWVEITGADFGPIAVDGIFGPETEQATRVFQDASPEVETDLVVNPADRVALREAIEAAEAEVAPVADFTGTPVETSGFPAGGRGATLTDMAVGDHSGFERVTFDLAGDPGELTYRVDHTDQVSGASGEPTPVEGSHLLEVVLTPAAGHDDSGEPTYTGPQRVAAASTDVITEVVIVEDFEGRLTFGIGLTGEVEVAHAVLDDPTRLVVDVRTTG